MFDSTSSYLTPVVQNKSEFGDHIEKAIIPLAFDHPDMFMSVSRFMSPDLFQSNEAKYVIAIILNMMQKYEIVPTRGVVRDFVLNHMTEDDPYQPILELIDTKSNPREVPVIKDQLVSWARKQAYGLIYGDEAMLAYHNGDFDTIERIIQEASRITDFSAEGMWLLDNYEILFNPETIEHRTTGFKQLDSILNNGGPGPKEVVCWLAGTNVGKSIVMCNNAITSWQGNGSGGRVGQDVLLVTFELDYIKTAMRSLGVMMENIPLDKLVSHQDLVTNKINALKNTYDGKIFIAELPPEQCSVDHLYTLMDNLKKTHGWKPDVLILDYLDLMVSRNKNYNNDDYTRQKYVANEVRGLAKNEKVLVFTATQTNRKVGADKGDVADLNRAAESYAKQFSMDYIISINQDDAERLSNPPRFRFYVAKNRNGPRNQVITCTIDYTTMKVREINR